MHRDEVAELKAIYDLVEEEERGEEEEATGELQTLKQECREKREDAIDDLRSVLDGRLEVIQDSFENAHLEYLERTDKRVSDFKHYTRVNKERERDIERCVRGIERLQLNMQEIRNNMQLTTLKYEDQRSLLAAEKTQVTEQVAELREKMRRFQGEQKTRRAGLAQNAEKSKKSLEGNIALAERILGLGEMARKRETEREKVQPFHILNDETLLMEAEVQVGGEVDPSNVLEDVHALSNFHKKYNKALAEKLVVENERNRLRQENDQLMVRFLVYGVNLVAISIIYLFLCFACPFPLLAAAEASPGWPHRERRSAWKGEPSLCGQWQVKRAQSSSAARSNGAGGSRPGHYAPNESYCRAELRAELRSAATWSTFSNSK